MRTPLLCILFSGLDGARCLQTIPLSGEVVVPLSSGGHAALATRGPSAFRLRLLSAPAAPLETPLVSPDAADSSFVEVQSARGRGITAEFGSLLVSPDSRLLLLAADGSLLTESAPLSLHEVALATKGGPLYGSGSGREDGAQLTSTGSAPSVANLATYTPYYYSVGDGYGVMAATLETGPGASVGGPSQTDPVGRLLVGYETTDQHSITWRCPGSFELYFMPAPTLALGTQAYYALVGAPRLPPLYAFGFIASRWGWRDRSYIESTLTLFRKLGFPLDAFIVDFEFFTTFNDYDLAAVGSAAYQDFGFNPVTFPSPQKQIAAYDDLGHVRMGAIRKPRLGNDRMLKEAREKGFVAEPRRVFAKERVTQGNILVRWLNFSKPAVREWYIQHMEPYLDAGVAFWWNDEGEADYFTFYWWNVAEREAQRRKDPKLRFFSLNRAFSPGMAKLGAALWTGDISHSWQDLAKTPGTMLKWALAGAPYVGCDIGGFQPQPGVRENADLVARWYQVGVFMPLMRVHSMITERPRFPWLWGELHAKIMREALRLRYRLVPYHYSLAHALYTKRQLWVQPMAMRFPEDTAVASMTSQWMDGDLLVAPVLREDSQRDVYLPAGAWYAFNSSVVTQGPKRLGGRAALAEVPVFVRAGAVVPLAPALQYTGQLPGGPLEVHVYAGADGAFDLVEDDGATMSYEAGAVRKLALAWDDAKAELSWRVSGTSPKAFEELSLVLFTPTGTQQSAVTRLEVGSVRVKTPGSK